MERRGWWTKRDETANWELLVQRPTERDPHLVEMLAKSTALLEAGATVDQAWRQAGFSSLRVFRKAFRAGQSVPPNKFREPEDRARMTHDRVRAAAKLILIGGRTLTEISELVGYKQSSLLSRAFQMVHGMTPTQWGVNHRDTKYSESNDSLSIKPK